MSVLNELGQYLRDNVTGLPSSFGTLVLGTNLYNGRRLPDTPDSVIGLIEYPGRAPVLTHSSNRSAAWEYPRVQVTARDGNSAGGYSNARNAIELIYQALTRVRGMLLYGTYYFAVRPQQSPFEMGPDAKDRPVYGFNVECWKAVSAS